MKKTGSMKGPSIAVRFINKMGEGSLPIVLRILSLKSQEEKAELMSCLINQFRGRICATVNSSLNGHGIDGAVQFSGVSAVRVEDGIRLLSTGVTINYTKSELVEKGVEIINHKDMNQKLSNILTGALKKFGLIMTVD